MTTVFILFQVRKANPLVTGQEFLSEQWGFGKTAQTFTLPISTQWSKVVAFHNGESPDTVSVKTDVVQSTFTVKTLSGAVDAHYISIGK